MTEMKQLPKPEIYDAGIPYWPYDITLEEALRDVFDRAPRGSALLDVMCGTGYLLGKIAAARPDLTLRGMDIDERYLAHARTAYPGISFRQGDIRSWWPGRQYPTVVCTGSIHHVPYEEQEKVIANIASMVESCGVAVISDCYVADYESEKQRQEAALKLGYEYLRYALKQEAPPQVIEWTIGILHNDVLRHEYKMSYRERIRLLKRYFRRVDSTETWPCTGAQYGEHVHICIAA